MEEEDDDARVKVRVVSSGVVLVRVVNIKVAIRKWKHPMDGFLIHKWHNISFNIHTNTIHGQGDIKLSWYTFEFQQLNVF